MALIAVIVVVAVGVIVMSSMAGGLASARPLSRGALVVPTLPAKPAVVDRAVILKDLASVRAGLKVGMLASSSCLDSSAASYAKAIAAKGVGGSHSLSAASSIASSCGGGVQTGWVLGVDPSGVTQSQSVLTRSPSGPSPLISAGVTKVGLAVVPVPGAHGKVSGYVLAWAVSK